MKKQYENILLTCTFQQEEELSDDQCLAGLFSRNADGSFNFNETVPKKRDIRNAKIFQGDFIALVKMKNGKLKLHFRTIDSVENPEELAFSIYSEALSALTLLK